MVREARIAFELIFLPPAGDGVPAASSLERWRPSASAVQAVTHWLSNNGMVGHDAGFSIAAQVPAAAFARLFGDVSSPAVPVALRPWIGSVVVSEPPGLW